MGGKSVHTSIKQTDSRPSITSKMNPLLNTPSEKIFSSEKVQYKK